jgi:hypothetical protein
MASLAELLLVANHHLHLKQQNIQIAAPHMELTHLLTGTIKQEITLKAWDRTIKNIFFLVIPFHLQPVLVHSANCAKKYKNVYNGM